MTMKLMTKAIEQRFATIGRQENDSNPIVVTKFFAPIGSATWYATEYNPQTRTFFGYVSLYGDHNDEWGYFSLDELEALRLPMGLRIERDMYCGEKRISEFNISSLK